MVETSLRGMGQGLSRWASAHPLAVLLLGVGGVALASLPTHWFTYNEIMHISDGMVDVPSLAWVLRLASEEVHGPFYAVVAWAFLALGLDDEAPFRLVSLSCFLGSVAVAYLLARDALGRSGALVAGIFVASNSFVLLFSHLFVRYDLHLLLGLLATHQLLKTRTLSGWRPALLFGLWLALGLLNLFTMGFTLLAFACLWMLLWRTSVNRLRPALAAAAACAVAAAIYLPVLRTPPEFPDKAPVGLSMGWDVLELFGGVEVPLVVAAILGVRVVVHRISPAGCLHFEGGRRPWLAIHLLLLVVPMAAQVLFSVVVTTCTDPWYVLPCVASSAVLFGALYEGSPRVVRALLIAVLAFQALGSIPQSRGGNPMVVSDVTLFADTTAVLDSLPDRTVPVFVMPQSILPGVDFYHRREGRGDLQLMRADALAGERPSQLCLLRWARMYDEVSVVTSAAPEALDEYELGPPVPSTSEDVDVQCYVLRGTHDGS